MSVDQPSKKPPADPGSSLPRYSLSRKHQASAGSESPELTASTSQGASASPKGSPPHTKTFTPTVSNARSGLVLSELLKMRISLDQATSLENACQVLAENISSMFEDVTVFVSILDSGNSLRLLGKVKEKTIERDQVLSAQRDVQFDADSAGWPESSLWQPSLTHRSLTEAGDECAFSCLFRGPQKDPFGVVTLVGKRKNCVSAAEKLSHLSEWVVPHLVLLQKASWSVVQKLRQQVGSRLPGPMKWATVLLLSTLLLIVRIPNRMQCDVEAKPVTRRYVSAPFEGVLRSSMVQPGDFVEKGDLLAQLDEDEIQLQRSSVEAEKEKFRKQKSAALAKGQTLAMQQAQLEFQRISLRNEMLIQRSQNLEITSPLSGMVLKNELEDAEGAPLARGQVLFEIAPLEKLVFLVYVSQQDVAYVEEGMQVHVHLEASREPLNGRITRIRPQAITFESESLFVAEVSYDNQRGLIRPGMRGYATIVGNPQTVGWILFRKPLGSLKRLAGF